MDSQFDDRQVIMGNGWKEVSQKFESLLIKKPITWRVSSNDESSFSSIEEVNIVVTNAPQELFSVIMHTPSGKEIIASTNFYISEFENPSVLTIALSISHPEPNSFNQASMSLFASWYLDAIAELIAFNTQGGLPLNQSQHMSQVNSEVVRKRWIDQYQKSGLESLPIFFEQ